MADPTAYFYQSLQSSPFAGTDPVKGSLEVERGLSDLATAREARAGQRLNQQLTGLNISEFQANAPLREAARDWQLGGMRELNTQFGAGLGAPAAGLGFPASLIRTESGGNWGALNADTGAAGRLQFMESRLADAKRAGVIPANMTADQFRADPAAQQRAEQWHFADINRYITNNNLNQFVGQTVKGVTVTPDGMVAVAHLGGSAGLKRFLESGGQYDPADANGTKLSDYLRIHGGQAAAAPAATPAPMMTLAPGLSPVAAAAAPRQPMMFSAPNAGMRLQLSAAGVPMTGTPEADLVPTTGAPAQSPFYVPGAGFVPGPAAGGSAPAAPAPSGQRPAFTRLPGAAPLGGPVEPSQPFADWLAGQAAASQSAYQTAITPGAEPTVSAAPAAPAPSPFATATPEAIANAPVSTNLSALGISPVGAPPAARAQAQAPAAPAVQPAGTIPAGLELIGPARQQLQQITQQRALLQQRMALARTLSPSEAAKELIAVQTENIALGRREMELQSDQAIGQMTMGQPQALNSIFQQTYGVQLQPVITNNRVTGYNLLRGNTVVAENVTPEALSRQARLGLNQTFREQEAAAALPLKKAQVDAWLETQKQLARATADTAIAQIKQQFTELAVAKQSETSFIVYDKNNPRAAFVVSETNVGVDGKPLPKGEKRWSSSPLAITPTVVR